MQLCLTHTGDPKKLHRELMSALDERTVFEKLLERAQEQAAEREAKAGA